MQLPLTQLHFNADLKVNYSNDKVLSSIKKNVESSLGGNAKKDASHLRGCFMKQKQRL